MGSPEPQGFSECHSTFRAACPVLVWPRLWVGSASGPCALASWCPCVVAFSFFFSWWLRSWTRLSLLPGALALPSCWLLHSLLYVVVEAFAQLLVDCLLDCLASSAVNHLWHGQGTHCLDRRAASPVRWYGRTARLCQRSGRCRCSWLYAVLL